MTWQTPNFSAFLTAVNLKTAFLKKISMERRPWLWLRPRAEVGYSQPSLSSALICVHWQSMPSGPGVRELGSPPSGAFGLVPKVKRMQRLPNSQPRQTDRKIHQQWVSIKSHHFNHFSPLIQQQFIKWYYTRYNRGNNLSRILSS